MRYAFAIGLTLLVSSAATGAEKPIPQDAARMEKRRVERLEWNRRTLQGAYDKIGKKDPRWDKAAREALDLAARMFSEQIEPAVFPTDIHVPVKKAVDAGCNDPLILYLYARTSVGKYFPTQDEYSKRFLTAAGAMSTSGYSPLRRAVAAISAAEQKASKKTPTPDEQREAERFVDAVLDLLPKSVAEDPRNEDWEASWYSTINRVIAIHRQFTGDYKAAFDRADAKLAKVAGIEALRLTVKGNFLILWGWEARTTAFAGGVTEAQFRAFETRLREARAALEAAWKAKPGEPHVAILMLDVEKANGQGDRDAMETWFERVMKADANNQRACWSKLDWLDPKWYGEDSGDEMMAFGKACRATNNWRAGITLLAADAHLRYRQRLKPADQMKYMKSPEVWSEIQSVYDEYLKHFPDDKVQRSKYATLCFFASHFPEAHAQFQAVGDGLAAWATFPYVPLETLKKIRDDTAQIVAGKMRVADPGQGAAGWSVLNGRNNDGQWSVNVPAKTERRQETGILGAKARNVFTCSAAGAKYTVRIQPVPPAARAGGAKAAAALNAARDAIAKEHGGRVRDEHPAMLGDHPAQEFLIDAPALRPTIVRVRVGVIGVRLYELSVFASEADVAGAAAVKFLDSFQIE